MPVLIKLMKARIALQGMELKKTGENKFAGYKYFELGDFLPQTMELFFELGVASVVSFESDYARLCITDLEDGTSITITSPMAEANLKGAHPIQNLGAVMSYQRRYLWLAAMEIVEHDIIDASDGAEKPKAKVSLVTPPAPRPELKIVEPKVTSGNPGEWQIILRENPGGEWAKAIVDATALALQVARTQADVQSIFKVNRVHFDRLKAEAQPMYEEILEQFKAVKSKLQQE